MALLDRLKGKDEREVKLQNEINSLQVRKESVMSVIQSDIAKLQREKEDVFMQAGARAYENYKGRLEEAAGLVEFWKKVEELEHDMQEKEEKKKAMEEKYNEEISLLQQGLGIRVAIENNEIIESNSSLVCPKCGNGVSAEDIFCEKCGTKLK